MPVEGHLEKRLRAEREARTAQLAKDQAQIARDKEAATKARSSFIWIDEPFLNQAIAETNLAIADLEPEQFKYVVEVDPEGDAYRSYVRIGRAEMKIRVTAADEVIIDDAPKGFAVGHVNVTAWKDLLDRLHQRMRPIQ